MPAKPIEIEMPLRGMRQTVDPTLLGDNEARYVLNFQFYKGTLRPRGTLIPIYNDADGDHTKGIWVVPSVLTDFVDRLFVYSYDASDRYLKAYNINTAPLRIDGGANLTPVWDNAAGETGTRPEIREVVVAGRRAFLIDNGASDTSFRMRFFDLTSPIAAGSDKYATSDAPVIDQETNAGGGSLTGDYQWIAAFANSSLGTEGLWSDGNTGTGLAADTRKMWVAAPLEQRTNAPLTGSAGNENDADGYLLVARRKTSEGETEYRRIPEGTTGLVMKRYGSSTITAWNVTGNVLTITTSAAHDLTVGDYVTIAGTGNVDVDAPYHACVAGTAASTIVINLVTADASGSTGTVGQMWYIEDDVTDEDAQANSASSKVDINRTVPPKGRHAMWDGNHMWLCNPEGLDERFPARVYFSTGSEYAVPPSVGDPHWWDTLTDYLDLGDSEDGEDSVLCGISVGDMRVFFKRNSIWLVTGRVADEFEAEKVAQGIGIQGPRSVTLASDGSIYGIGASGFFRMRGREVQLLPAPQILSEAVTWGTDVNYDTVVLEEPRRDQIVVGSPGFDVSGWCFDMRSQQWSEILFLHNNLSRISAGAIGVDHGDTNALCLYLGFRGDSAAGGTAYKWTGTDPYDSWDDPDQPAETSGIRFHYESGDLTFGSKVMDKIVHEAHFAVEFTGLKDGDGTDYTSGSLLFGYSTNGGATWTTMNITTAHLKRGIISFPIGVRCLTFRWYFTTGVTAIRPDDPSPTIFGAAFSVEAAPSMSYA